ncbi:MAG: amino acid adenylation domain-containing protein, partial [candidate division Zixibacteria bacterium]|nr:amino acid adenylation domain-containing protein [candidate division Zixibacteria bacterium]
MSTIVHSSCQNPPAEARGAETWHPLSASQRSFWFLYRLQPDRQGTYNQAFCVRVHGGLDPVHLSQALDRLAARHPMVRVGFREIDGEPAQCAYPRVAVPVAVYAVAELDPAQLEARVREDLCRPLELTAAPLLRANLYRWREGQSLLLLVFDHLICDGWSFWRLIEELGQILEAGPAHEEPGGEPGYFAYARWQERWLAGERGRKQLAYWRTALAEDYPALDVPTDRPRGGQPSTRRDSVAFVLPADLSHGLRQWARQHRATLYMTLLTAYFILLRRLSGQDRITVGSPLPARGDGEWDRTVGDFLNPVVLRAAFDPALTVGGLLRAVRETAVRAMANQDYPLPELVERLNPRREQGRTPYFQTLFVFQNPRGATEILALMAGREGPTVRWGGLELSPFTRIPIHGGAAFDLLLEVAELGETIVGGFEYGAALFERGTVERYLGYWRTLLLAMVADDEQAVDRLPLLGEIERRRVLYDWNATAAQYPQLCVQELFEQQAAKTPDAIALVHEEHSLRYGELNVRANRLAHYLRGLGVKPDERVAICLERNLGMVVGLLAILKAGGAYVPLDPAYPPDRLSYMLEDSQPVVVLTQAGLETRFEGQSGNLAMIDLSQESAWADQPESNPERRDLTPEHLAYVIYTSGSTGKPKGVAMPHRPLVNLVGWQKASTGSPLRTLQFAAFSFDVSFQEIFSTLCSGGELVLIGQAMRQDFGKLPGFLRAARIQRLFLPYIALQTLAECAGETADGWALQEVITAGEPLRITPAIAGFFRRLQGCRLHNHYGPSETHVVTAFTLAEEVSSWPVLPAIGRPIANSRIYILDAQGQPVPVGVAGEIHIGGAGVARGYLNQAELTAERFLADPFAQEPHARMYKTGDLARYREDGNIEFLGRNDFQVKIRGFRIELGEIEAKLAEYPGIREAVVLARGDQGDQRLVAYYTSDEELGAEILRTQLAAELPEYMIPAAYVKLDSLPLTPNGKLDRKALPNPEGEAYVTRGYEAPQGEVEQKLAKIWAELLNVDRVGRQDHFFELGGHSLLAVQVISRIRQTLGIEAGLADLFAKPILADFAAALGGATQAELPPIIPVERGERLALSFAQQRLWFLAQFEGVSEAYHIAGG